MPVEKQSAEALQRHVAAQGVLQPVRPENLHVTLLKPPLKPYSPPLRYKLSQPMLVLAKGFSVRRSTSGDKYYLKLTLDAPVLTHKKQQYLQSVSPASITVCYDYPTPYPASDLKLPPFKIQLEQEIVREHSDNKADHYRDNKAGQVFSQVA